MKLKDLQTPFYNMFIMEDDLRMEDLQAMWEALLNKYEIPIPAGWNEFLDNVNCFSGLDRNYFNNQFNKL